MAKLLNTIIGNDINSSISINGPTATSLYGTATYFTVALKLPSTMDSKLIPLRLMAALTRNIITHNIEKVAWKALTS